MLTTVNDPAAVVASALERAGYKVTRPRNPTGYYASHTAVCHGGDTPMAMYWTNDGNGGLYAGCRTAKHRTGHTAPILKSLAGVERGRDDYRPPPPGPALANGTAPAVPRAT